MRKAVEYRICDLHPKGAAEAPATRLVAFTYQGRRYRLDACAQCGRDADATLARLVRAATGGAGKVHSRATSASARREAEAIRAWAADRGYTLQARGRIPAGIRRAYEQAQLLVPAGAS